MADQAPTKERQSPPTPLDYSTWSPDDYDRLELETFCEKRS